MVVASRFSQMDEAGVALGGQVNELFERVVGVVGYMEHGYIWLHFLEEEEED